jgi:hypothetical protein
MLLNNFNHFTMIFHIIGPDKQLFIDDASKLCGICIVDESNYNNKITKFKDFCGYNMLTLCDNLPGKIITIHCGYHSDQKYCILQYRNKYNLFIRINFPGAAHIYNASKVSLNFALKKIAEMQTTLEKS